MENNNPTHKQNAETLLAAIDAYLATLPKIEKVLPGKARAAAAVPIPFMASAFGQLDQSEELKKYIVADTAGAQVGLEYLEICRPVYERLLKAQAELKDNIDAHRVELAFQSLQIYTTVQRLSRQRRAGKVEFQLMQKELRRKRRAKPDEQTPSTTAPVNPGSAPPITPTQQQK